MPSLRSITLLAIPSSQTVFGSKRKIVISTIEFTRVRSKVYNVSVLTIGRTSAEMRPKETNTIQLTDGIR